MMHNLVEVIAFPSDQDHHREGPKLQPNFSVKKQAQSLHVVDEYSVPLFLHTNSYYVYFTSIKNELRFGAEICNSGTYFGPPCIFDGFGIEICGQYILYHKSYVTLKSSSTLLSPSAVQILLNITTSLHHHLIVK